MSKCYFVSVRTYQSVNNMGLELGRYVEQTYHHTLVPADEFKEVIADIKAKMKELEEKFPRSRPFKLEVQRFTDSYKLGYENIYVSPQNKNIDTHVFVLETDVVRGREKGGAL